MRHQAFPVPGLSVREVYGLMIALVAPRPIAWVSTVDREGRANLAPFSYFQAVCSAPPVVVLGLSSRGDGKAKDTLANILDTREFTVSHVDVEHAEAMNLTSTEWPPEIDEWRAVGIASAPAAQVAPPRVADARAALECRLTHAIPFGNGPRGGPSATLVIGEVVCFTLAEAIVALDPQGRLRPPTPAQLRALGRLGGIAYTEVTTCREIPRPGTPRP